VTPKPFLFEVDDEDEDDDDVRGGDDDEGDVYGPS